MRMILLNLELLRKLAIDGFDHLAHCIEQMLGFCGQLLLLVAPGQRGQPDSILLKQFCGLLSADIAFVAQYLQIGMLAQDLKTDFQVRAMRWRQLKIQNQTAQGDQQMQFETEIVCFREDTLPKVAPKAFQSPLEPGTR